MKVNLICKYCDSRWTEHVYNQGHLINVVCPKCRDSKNMVQDQRPDAGIIDTYVGAPPFPVKNDIPDDYL